MRPDRARPSWRRTRTWCCALSSNSKHSTAREVLRAASPLLHYPTASGRVHGLTALLGMLRTVERNVAGGRKSTPILERTALNPRFPVSELPAFHRRLRAAAAEILWSLDGDMRRREAAHRGGPRIRLGVGIFAFEGPPPGCSMTRSDRLSEALVGRSAQTRRPAASLARTGTSSSLDARALEAVGRFVRVLARCGCTPADIAREVARACWPNTEVVGAKSHGGSARDGRRIAPLDALVLRSCVPRSSGSSASAADARSRRLAGSVGAPC